MQNSNATKEMSDIGAPQVDVSSGLIKGVIFGVSNDGGKTAVAWRENVFDAFTYLALQNKNGVTDYSVVALRRP